MHPVDPSAQRRLRALAAVLVIAFAATSLSGCLGIERTEWAYKMTQLTALESKGLTGEGVLVGIVDTGIEPKHPSMDHIDIRAWRDYINGRDAPYDDVGHGTHVAGIIAARGGAGDFLSGADVKGVAPDVSLVVVKACGSDTCDGDAIERGIDWAVDQGIDILTLSLGGEQVVLNLGDGPLRAVQRAVSKGVYVVVAAGNDGTDDGDVASPSSAKGAIAVGAVDRDGRVAGFSSRGSPSANQAQGLPTGGAFGGRADPNKKPELVAPGVEILSAWKDGTYAKASGTSQAAPFVAGALALMLESEPEWRRMGSRNNGEPAVTIMKTVLTESARPVDGQTTPHDNAAGYGILQANDALKRLAGR